MLAFPFTFILGGEQLQRLKYLISTLLILVGPLSLANGTETMTLSESSMIWVPELDNDIVLSNGFKPHQGFIGSHFRLEPIHRNHSPIDYVAWHEESWEDLRVLYGAAWDWPREMSEAQNAEDLEHKHYVHFLTQNWITYEVLSLDGKRAYGSLYITPQACGSYQAHAMYWITTPLRQQLEQSFHDEVKVWLNSVWPWKKTYFPGPEVSDTERGSLYQKMENGHCPD